MVYNILNFIQSIDNNIINLFYNNQNLVLDKIMIFSTKLGNYGIIWIIVTLLLVLSKKTRKIGIYCIIALILFSIIVNLGIKPLVQRARPFNQIPDLKLLIPAPKDFSFPSGHANASFTVIGVLFTQYKKYKLNVLFVFSTILAILVSVSRIYLSVHFPSDVIAGTMIGLVTGILVSRLKP